MAEAKSKGDAEKARAMQDLALRQNMAKIKHKMIIISGKGGVGKSTVAVNTAIGLALSDREVGILDVDIHGPSLGKMLGIEGRPMQVNADNRLAPIHSKGLHIVTLASMLRDIDAPIIWRGPLKMNAIKQLLAEVDWPELDYLIIDSPPGTGDEPLSVCQLIPEIDGAIVVTTPQEVALIDSRKAIRFAEALKVRVLGIVENMSGFKCPHCGKSIDLFKSGGGERAATEFSVPFLGRISIDPNIVEASDMGRAYIADSRGHPAAQAMEDMVKRVLQMTEATAEIKAQKEEAK
jgi:Mrp family chromosome partitioning ATPase